MPDQAQTEENIAIIILAAGRSSRLGSPKQLLEYRGTSLLQHSIDAATGSMASSVIIILGSDKENIEKQLNREQIIITENPDWESGMASSIRCGINEILNSFSKTDAAIIMVCDQPYVSSDLLNELILAHQTSGKAIIASSYDNILGTPALFHKSMFHELMALKGDKGARVLFNKFHDQTGSIDFKDGRIDIDTSENYKNLAK
ncbi:nucleotidyltransferase family protein [Daejeonella sp. H1SJ63]|jgi:molybdenum cofactor cytidylyltransferase|uniref:nucleotidyltransferase family protein n=1 Tax=Daejeonella sp. H1SJ63 TaxID=3034145 RepID=UPI0023EA908F|nr:nucleotidyltransferase family protein [Daejeonella sp. H1SJ63]